MNDLLNKETLAAVIAASPDLPGNKEEARAVLEVLKFLTREFRLGTPFYYAIVQDTANQVMHATAEVYTARNIGSVLRSMGLSGYRTRDGYRYAWTKEQLDILEAALK